MNGGSHRLFAAASWPAVATFAPIHTWQIIAGIPVAIAFANAPDWDNLPFFRKIDRLTPDEALGGGGPLGHRQLLHWWGIPVLLALAATRADLGAVGWAVYSALVGYGSHIVLDAPFGEEGMGTKQGVPIFLWYGRIGGWFYSDRFMAKACIWPLCLGLCWVGAGSPTTFGPGNGGLADPCCRRLLVPLRSFLDDLALGRVQPDLHHVVPRVFGGGTSGAGGHALTIDAAVLGINERSESLTKPWLAPT